MPETKRNLDAIRQFLIDKKIVTLPSEVKAIVKETPQHARAKVLLFDGYPGPLKNPCRRIISVTPVESNWDDKQKEEWLTAFNYYTTDVVFHT